MAISARWRIPPLNSCGRTVARRSGVGDADPVEHLDRPRAGPAAG